MSGTKDPVLVARGHVARESSRHGRPERLIAARQDLATAKIERAIAENIAAAPPLRPEQRDKLVGLLSAVEVSS
jgi:hypothetical protein